MADGERADKGAAAPPRARGCHRAISAFKDIFVGAVNPRFGRFTYAFTLAFLVGLITSGALVAIFISVTFKCEETCSSIPVGVLQNKVNQTTKLEQLKLVSSNPLKCYGFSTSDWVLQAEVSQKVYDMGLNTSYIWDGFKWESSTSRVSSCSRLHHTEEARRQWATMAQAMLAFNNMTLDKEPSSAAWDPPLPLAAAMAYNKVLLASTPMLNASWGYAAAPQLTSRCNAAVREASAQDNSTSQDIWVSARGWPLVQRENIRVTFTGSETGTGYLWQTSPTQERTLELKAEINPNNKDTLSPIQDAEVSSAPCSFATGSMMSVSVALDLPSPQSVALPYCSNPANYQAQAKLRVTACQTLMPDGPYATKLCIQGSRTYQITGTDNYYNNQCSGAGSPSASWPSDCELGGASMAELAPALVEMGVFLGNWMPQGVTTVSKEKGNATDVQGWWMQTSLYCCKCSYPDLLASLGSALGYQVYLEIAAATLVMMLYLSLYKKERERLGMDAFSFIQMATEIDEAEKKDGSDKDDDHGQSDSSTAVVVVTARSGPGPIKPKDGVTGSPGTPGYVTSSTQQRVRDGAALPGVA